MLDCKCNILQGIRLTNVIDIYHVVLLKHTLPPRTSAHIKSMMKSVTAILFLLPPFLPLLHAFATVGNNGQSSIAIQHNKHRSNKHDANSSSFSLHMIDQKRKNQLGISDDEDEYDLYRALDVNTDKGITKIVAGSFILVMIALLVVGLV